MSKRSTPTIRRGLRFLAALLLTAGVSAQPPTLSIVPKNAGPVDIADLRLLIDMDIQFQLFDFESEESFCLLLGYVHEINGQLSSRRPADRGACNQAGRHRLIVVMRSAGDKRTLFFGVHNRDTGAGSTNALVDLPIGKDISGWAAFRPGETIQADREATLLTWRYGRNPPHPGPRHDVHILVRLAENDGRVGSYP